MSQLSMCGYVAVTTGNRCELKSAPMQSYCEFHQKSVGSLGRDVLQAKLTELISLKYGNWVEFRIPSDIRLPSFHADFPIDARGIKAQSIRFDNCHFNAGLDLRDAEISGSLVFEGGAINNKPALLSRLAVDKTFRWAATANANVLMEDCHFKGAAKILGEFNGVANFAGSVFHESAEFVGGMIRYAASGNTPTPPDRARYVFNGDVFLNQIDFRRPNRSRFRHVDLRRAQLADTDFRGVAFYAVLWDQPTLGRRGIYDEVFANSIGELKRHLPRLEDAYRNLRAAHEDSKDFQSATDFYVGELECRRRQQSPEWKLRFGVEALYKFASKYGASPLIAARNLILVLALHMLLATAVLNSECFVPTTGCRLSSDIIVNSLRLLTILGGPHFQPLPSWGAIIDIGAQVLVGVQAALLIFALRSRIRRG